MVIFVNNDHPIGVIHMASDFLHATDWLNVVFPQSAVNAKLHRSLQKVKRILPSIIPNIPKEIEALLSKSSQVATAVTTDWAISINTMNSNGYIVYALN